MGGNIVVKKILKTTKYCDLISQVSLVDEEYTYCIERIYVKQKKRDEIRFSLYRDTAKADNRYIPRSLCVTELELIELIGASLKEKILSSKFLEILKQEVSKS